MALFRFFPIDFKVAFAIHDCMLENCQPTENEFPMRTFVFDNIFCCCCWCCSVRDRKGWEFGNCRQEFYQCSHKRQVALAAIVGIVVGVFFVAAEIKSRMHCKYSHNAIQKMDFFPGIDNRIKACFSGFTVMFSFFLPLSWSLCYPYNFLNDMPLFLSHVIPNKKKLCDVWYYSGVIRMQNTTRCVSTV